METSLRGEIIKLNESIARVITTLKLSHFSILIIIILIRNKIYLRVNNKILLKKLLK